MLSATRLLIGLTAAAVLMGWRSADAPPPIIANPGLEADADHDGWPDGWPRGGDGCTWEAEGKNHFLRLSSSKPGQMVMYYREIALPKGTRALELRWRQRVTGLKRGRQSWFDARLLLEFLDGDRKKVGPEPPAAATAKDTDGWQDRRLAFLVPPGATTLKLMPCLFKVHAGTFDLDDVSLAPADPAVLEAAAAARAKAAQAKRADRIAIEQKKAARTLTDSGSLIANGSFEAAKDGANPDGWGAPGKGVRFERENGNRYLRLTADPPDALVMVFREIALPADVRALELTWRYRLAGFKRGELPWYDARFILKFIDADGKHLGDAPPAIAGQTTGGWKEGRTAFLVPSGAVKLQLMPCLFRAARGTFDLDDLVLRPTDPAPLLAAQAKRDREAGERYVPPEEPRRERWPAELRVRGNRLVNPGGTEVWLQGVNAGGLETLHADTQVIKSAVVAIDGWKANVVRLPVTEAFWFGRDPTQKDGGRAYRATIDRIVTLCANRGAYLVLDLHRFRAPRAEHVEFWKAAAAHYKNHPAVLFDLFNEPHDISWEVWQKGGLVGKEMGKDEAAFLSDEEKARNRRFASVGMQALVDAVRSTGAKNVVLAGGVAWAGDLSGVADGYALQDRTGNGVMYSWHQYNWHKGWARTVLPAAAKYPIFVGEVGADTTKMTFIPAEAQEDPYTWVPDMLGFIQSHRLSWAGWCFHPRATPLLISDWSYSPTPYWGAFAKRALAGEQFKMKRMR